MKRRLCIRPFDRESRPKDELYCPTPLGLTTKVLLVKAHLMGLFFAVFDISRAQP